MWTAKHSAGALVLVLILATAAEAVEPYDLTQLALDSPGAAAAELAAAEGLPSALAEAVIDALLIQERLQEDRWDAERNRSGVGASETEALLDRWFDLFAAAPESEFLGAALAEVHRTFDDPSTRDAMAARLATRVAQMPDPARSALALSRQMGWSVHSRELLGLALEERPGHPALLHHAAALTDDPAVRAALYDAAWEALAEVRPAPSRRAIQLFSRQRVAALLEAGVFDEAVELWADLAEILELPTGIDPSEREAGAAAAEVGGLPLDGESDAFDLQLAALAGSAGKAALARRLLAAGAAPPPDGPPAGVTRPDAEIVRDLLARLLEPEADDPFLLFTELAAAMKGGSWDPQVDSPAVQLAAAGLAEAEGHPEIAAWLLGLVIERLEWRQRMELEAQAAGRSSLPPLGRKIEVRVAAYRARLASFTGGLRARRAALQALAAPVFDPGAAIVARALAAGPARLVEQPLPAGIQPLSPGAALMEWVRGGAQDYELPADLEVKRFERSGDEVVAIGRDSYFGDYDGRYWAVRSGDGGNTWSEPLYTGLRERWPYGVPRASDLPLEVDGRLTLEVDLWNLDPSAEREPLPRGIYLELRWDALERDGDGDGLTDLAEELLLTNAAVADGDGDGLADGLDPLPHVAREPGCGPRAQALAAVLRFISPSGLLLPEAAESAPGGCASAGPLPFGPAPESHRYLVAQRSWFAEIATAIRLVVLTEDELASAEAVLGRLDPLHIDLLAFDHAGERVLAAWHGRGQGLLALRRYDGAWKRVFSISGGGGCSAMTETDWTEPLEP